ncbi:MAG: MBL fold metallo-hydrolase [Oscillospiraceae bacterium]|nr:MBL fold metallo-hydrolase [Oscillospiraceae bacterium]
MKKRIPLAAASLALLLTGCGQTASPASTAETQPSASAETSAQAEETASPLTVTFLKVGKADGIVLQTANHTVIIDCGETGDGSRINALLSESGVTTIDCMILTHFDQDHIGGAPEVLENYPVQQVIAADYTESGKEYKALCKALEAQQLTMQQPTEEMTFTLDDCTFTVYPHKAEDYKNGYDNNCSLVTRLVHHDNVLLFTGDAMEERLDEIMDIGDCDLLKVPYHGRELKNMESFLDAVTPEYAVICTSKPEVEDVTVSQLESRSIATYVTGIDGNITAVSDGETITVETTKSKKS